MDQGADRQQLTHRPGPRLAIGLALAAAMLLGGAAQGGVDAGTAPRDRAFVAAQRALSSEAADALAQVSARFAGGDDDLGRLAERRQDLAVRRDQLEREMERLYAAPGDEGVRQRREAQAAYDRALADLRAADAEIDARFPAYAELTRPRALEVAETQGLLAADEGLLLVLVNADAAYVWGVTRERIAWARADDLGTDAMADAVAHLRRSLGVSAARSRPYAPRGAAGPVAFDADAAHGLYRALIAPVESVFQGKTTLITVTGGDLASLPLAVLPVEPGRADGWLIDRYALASLPSVSSLLTLRCLRPGAGARPAACPAGLPAAPQTAARRDGVVMAAFGAPLLAGAEVEAGRGAPGAGAVFGDARLADVERLRALPALPGSRAELEALRQRYPSALVRMGAEATETAVRRTDAEALAGARFVVFSTHGLLAGTDQAEPGLVMTPPATPSADDDGYLTASEAAGLELTAEFVVLSACNTAGGAGPGGEGLSGLARAFFYAGARSLLVSHWEVSDAATTRLVTSAFEALDTGDRAGDPGQRARALRAAMLAVRAERRWSHPAYWGGFTLVGEPG